MVSVLLPVRNGSRTLDIALDSLMRQSHLPTECIVVDDGSTDSTAELLKQWSSKWPAIRSVRTSGVGIAKALNIGLQFCGSQWIARMDADDRCHPLRFERQLNTAEEHNANLVSCRVTHWNETDEGQGQGLGMSRHIEWVNSKITHDEIALAHWIDSALPHPTWIARQEIFEIVGLYEESEDLPEDYEWLHRFFSLANDRKDFRARKTDGEALLDWRDSPARLTRSSSAYDETAFNRVKAGALAKWLHAREDNPEVFVFGLGPKSKAMLKELELPLRAIVDVHPRRKGILYNEIEVWDVERWREHVGANPAPALVLNCVGTPEARENCEQLCIDSGLRAGESFISL